MIDFISKTKIFYRINGSINEPEQSASPNIEKMKEIKLFSKETDDNSFGYNSEINWYKETMNGPQIQTRSENMKMYPNRNKLYFSNKILARYALKTINPLNLAS